MGPERADEVADLLSHMIRNACVNDGTPESGHEQRNAELLKSLLEGPGLDLETLEPFPGRASVVARIEGSEPTAPSLMLLGHTDVVPANPDDWRRDPFGGELVDGEVWGRGAVDMLNLTSSMAVAVRDLAREGFRPRGDLVFIGVADEEGLGIHGAGYLAEHLTDQVRTDYLITEAGGFPMGTDDGVRLPVITGEKGVFWCTLTIRGTPGHGSQPLRTDSAVVKAAVAVQRLAEYAVPAEVHDAWRQFVEGIGLPREFAEPLLDPSRIDAFCRELPMLGLARQAHACTHTTIAPTILHGGTKVNVIPDRAQLQLDIRGLPGWDVDDVESMLRDALGDLSDDVDISWNSVDPASTSPTDTPLWDALERVSQQAYPGARCVPFLTVGATDARFFRRLGTTAYGFGLFSNRMSFEDYAVMFHGVDERVDVESLGLSADLWEGVARDFVG
ncbi:MAG TPA: M20/M25/M40 family metallo-hydrolase [Acidimicrobiales bacterium]|nr:M20/M25/M40 family metallo-hydrolase [Acidimicrobiales bacterium]